MEHEDTTFVATIKEKVWENLSERYQDKDIHAFLHEATAMDPRFKGRPVSDATWDRLRKATVEANVRSNTRAVRGAGADRHSTSNRRSLKERKWRRQSLQCTKQGVAWRSCSQRSTGS